jgi:signal peptidase I
VVLVVVAVVIAVVVRAFVFQAFYIPSESMVPTLQVGDRVLVNKLSYRLHDPRRGDVVVFRAPPAAAAGDVKDLVKRVVGLPGDRIEGRDGRVYVNGRRIREPYLPSEVRSRDFGPVAVPPDTYYVLGDNRPFSKDSTFFGPVRRSDIVGRVFVRIWPLTRFRLF